MIHRILCCYGLEAIPAPKIERCRVFLELPFCVEVALRPKYFSYVRDFACYSAEHYTDALRLKSKRIKQVVEDGQPHWINIDLDDVHSIFEQARKQHYGNGIRIAPINDCAIAWVYDEKKENIYIYEKDFDQFKQLIAGDTAEIIARLEAEEQKRVDWGVEYAARKNEYVEALKAKAQKMISEAANECAFLLDDATKRQWMIKKLDLAQSEVMEDLGYE